MGLNTQLSQAVITAAVAAVAKADEDRRVEVAGLRALFDSMHKPEPASSIILQTSLVVLPEACLKLVEPKPLLHGAPRLVLNAVTRYLDWEDVSYRQRYVEAVERDMLGRAH